MTMERLGNILIVALTAAAFTAGCLLGRHSVDPVVETVEQLRIDTVFYPRPVAAAVTRRPVTIQVPRLLFAERVTPSEIVHDTTRVVTPDSVSVDVAVETRIYEDTLYRAQVSGPVVGSLVPSLDWISVYDRTRTVTQTVTKRHRFAVTAGVGAAYTEHGIQPVAGVQVGVVLFGF